MSNREVGPWSVSMRAPATSPVFRGATSGNAALGAIAFESGEMARFETMSEAQLPLTKRIFSEANHG